MKRRPALKHVAAAILCCAFAAGQVLAAPPDGKGKPDNAGQGQGKGNSGKGNNGKGNSGKDNNGHGNSSGGGNKGGGDVTLRHAGITITTARGYAQEYGLSGYSSLPPGVRKNLARGKPLPPGIAKKWCPDRCWRACRFIPAMNGGWPVPT